MDCYDKQELAWHYVHSQPDPEVKRQVFQLILTDNEFKQLLKDEILLVQSMQKLRESLHGELKEDLLGRIKSKLPQQTMNSPSDSSSLIQWVLKMTLPPFAYFSLDHIQRRCSI